MSARIRCGAWCLCSLVLCLAVVGCGSGLVKPEGKIVKDGQPFSLSAKGLFQMSISVMDTKGGDKGGDRGPDTFAVDSKPDGTFTVMGKEGKGVPPGKYRFSIQAMDPYPGHDLLGGRASGPNSPIVENVSASPITIDVGKYISAGKKK